MAVFTREATGLLRELGFVDHLIISLSCINIIGGFVLSTLAAAFFFPGSNLVAVFLLGAIPALAFVGMYSILSAAIPRSGGDYIWTGRILGARPDHEQSDFGGMGNPGDSTGNRLHSFSHSSRLGVDRRHPRAQGLQEVESV